MADTNTNHNYDDDDDSVLDIADQHNRPADTAFNQQRIQAWHPILDPWWVIVALYYLGFIMFFAGLKFDSIQKNVVELEVEYDNYDLSVDELSCGITEYNEDKNCTITFVVPELLKPPVLIHYRLKNFHQNHRDYTRSVDRLQLKGLDTTDPSTRSGPNNYCHPLEKLGNTTLNPCGLIANTFFNDIFTLIDGRDINGRKLQMIEEGIAWTSDVEEMYNQPYGFRSEECPAEYNCSAACCDNNDNEEEWSCKEPYVDDNGNCYRYYYPDEDTTQYLYETYPKIINPIDGVQNEHFMVWMRVATSSDFRKLYGWINQTVPANTNITFRINANYMIRDFRGSKSLLMGTTSIIGGKNPYIAPVFIYPGIFCIFMATLFLLKQSFRPRKIADRAYLAIKED